MFELNTVPTLWEMSWVVWALVALMAVRKKRYHKIHTQNHHHESLISGRKRPL